MSVKMKYRDEWLDADEAADRRRAEQSKQEPGPPPVDVAALPAPETLDPDVPLEQLFFECPAVRAYITKDGHVRSGLKASAQEVARAILAKYGGQA